MFVLKNIKFYDGFNLNDNLAGCNKLNLFANEFVNGYIAVFGAFDAIAEGEFRL
jgi:hypothetical protein